DGQKAHERAQERGLAGAVATDDSDTLAGRDAQRKVAQHRTRAIADGAMERDERRHARSSGGRRPPRTRIASPGATDWATARPATKPPSAPNERSRAGRRCQPSRTRCASRAVVSVSPSTLT